MQPGVSICFSKCEGEGPAGPGSPDRVTSKLLSFEDSPYLKITQRIGKALTGLSVTFEYRVSGPLLARVLLVERPAGPSSISVRKYFYLCAGAHKNIY